MSGNTKVNNQKATSTDPGLLDQRSLENHPQFASTLANGLAILGCFRHGQSVLGNKDLAEQLDFSRPTVSRLTFTLTGLGYLRRDEASGKYALGPAVLSLGYPLLSQMTIRQVAAPEMLELSKIAHGPVSIGMRDRLQVVYIETVRGAETNFTNPGIGSTRPLLRTAMGRALLSAHSSDDRTRILARLRELHQEDWRKFAGAMQPAIGEIREKGFCTAIGDWQPNLAAVAVPLRAQFNGVHLAFNLTLPTYETSQDELDRNFGPRLVNLVRNVERSLGFGTSGHY